MNKNDPNESKGRELRKWLNLQKNSGREGIQIFGDRVRINIRLLPNYDAHGEFMIPEDFIVA